MNLRYRFKWECVLRLVLTLAAPVLSLSLVTRFTPNSFFHPVLFVALTITASGIPALHTGRSLRQHMARGMLLFGFPVLAAWVLWQNPRSILFVGLVVAGAAAEEVIFRWVVPRRCYEILQLTRANNWRVLGLLITCQFVFAVCHSSVFTGLNPIGAEEFLRLVTAGVALQTIQISFGLGVAIGVHASLNLLLLTSAGVARVWSPGVMFVFFIICCSMLFLRLLSSNDGSAKFPISPTWRFRQWQVAR
jgi:hypothetical protein